MDSKDWLESAKTRDDDRPIFDRTEHKDGLSIAGDGHRFHVAEDDLKEYVDWKSILRKVKPISKGITVAFNPKYLINALTGLDNVAVLHVSGRGDFIEISGTVSQRYSPDKTKCYAIIAAMSDGREPHQLWRPIEIDSSEPEEDQEEVPPTVKTLKTALKQMLYQFKDNASTTEEKAAVGFAEGVLGFGSHHVPSKRTRD